MMPSPFCARSREGSKIPREQGEGSKKEQDMNPINFPWRCHGQHFKKQQLGEKKKQQKGVVQKKAS